MSKRILSVIIGYAIFVAITVFLFKITGQKSHYNTAAVFIILTAIYGSAFLFASRLVVPLISKTSTLTLNYILSFIIAEFAAFSLIKSGGSHWTQLLAIFIFCSCFNIGRAFIH